MSKNKVYQAIGFVVFLFILSFLITNFITKDNGITNHENDHGHEHEHSHEHQDGILTDKSPPMKKDLGRSKEAFCGAVNEYISSVKETDLKNTEEGRVALQNIHNSKSHKVRKTNPDWQIDSTYSEWVKRTDYYSHKVYGDVADHWSLRCDIAVKKGFGYPVVVFDSLMPEKKRIQLCSDVKSLYAIYKNAFNNLEVDRQAYAILKTTSASYQYMKQKQKITQMLSKGKLKVEDFLVDGIISDLYEAKTYCKDSGLNK